MSKELQNKQHKLAKGGWRPNAGRKKTAHLRTHFISARTTKETKDRLIARTIRDQTTESDIVHVALEEYFRRHH
jgi:hypothetical protein